MPGGDRPSRGLGDPWRAGIDSNLHAATQRLELRTLTPDTVNDIYVGWWNDPLIQTQLASKPRGWTLEQARKHVMRFDNRWNFHLGIYWRESAALIGFTSIQVDPVSKVCINNTVIGDKTMWRCGVARELYAWTIPFAFLHLNVRKVKAVIFGANESSIALTESLGFQREALLRSEYPSSEKDRLDIHIFGLMKEEWLALKGAGQQPWCWDWLPPVAAGAFEVR